MACRVLKVSTSGFYESRLRPASIRDRDDAELTNIIAVIHNASRQTYGVRRIHAELRHGHGLAISHKRVWRCMKLVGLQGVHRRRWRRPRPATASWPDLVNRQFPADGPDRLGVNDITQHRTAEGWVYAAVVLDVYSRRVVGWSVADHLRTELVAEALDMARLRRKPHGTVVHSDCGTQYTSGSSGTGCGNPACWAPWAWITRPELATAISEYIEAFYNPVRRHSALDYRSPIDYERQHSATHTAA